MAQGKLIVLEGTDGSGKGTQFKLLVDYLSAQHIPYETMDFPRYGKSFFGNLAGRMLAGDFGGAGTIASEMGVLPFACDRWLLKDDLKKWLSEGKIVVSNRYTASSAVYHAGKLPKDKQYAFIDWVYKLEQEVIGLPSEDIAIYFHVPVSVSQQLIEKKAAREYLGGKKKDIYEADSLVQETVEQLYLDLAVNRNSWKTIECVREGVMRKPEEIHNDVLDVLRVNKVL